jgi:hypothetical protein
MTRDERFADLRTWLVLAAAVFLVAFIISALTKAKRISVPEKVTMSASIEAIDKTARSVTLNGLWGSFVTVFTNNEFRKFEMFNVGDEVSATYSIAAGARIGNPGSTKPLNETSSIETFESAGNNDVALEQTIMVSIEEIDRTASSITVKTGEGSLLNFRIDDLEQLQSFKVGERVDVKVAVRLSHGNDPPPSGY